MNPKVYVLLSTYNGERYLEKQIDSILKQKKVNIELIVRDDGSKDQTKDILNKYKNYNNIYICFENNIGWKKSFTKLMQNVEQVDGCYYAFADQDDVWESNKLDSAIKMLADNVPMVYHSNVSQMDGNLNYLGKRFGDTFQPTSNFPKCFFDGYGIGSTMVFNSKLLKLVQLYYPNEATNHDALVILLGYIFGEVVFDPRSFIKYRRHSNSATAFSSLAKSGKPNLMERYNRYKKGEKNQFSVRARQIVNGYSNYLSPKQLQVFKEVAYYKKNILYKALLLMNPKISASGIRKTLQIKYRIIVDTL